MTSATYDRHILRGMSPLAAACLGCLLASMVTVQPADGADPLLGKFSPRGARRVVHCSDPLSYFANAPDSRGDGTHVYSRPAKPEEFRRWIRLVAAAGTDTYVPEVFFDGLTMHYRSERIPYWHNEQSERFQPLMDAGFKPLEIFIDESHRLGMELVPGFRMNDRHGVNKKFFKEHPEWTIKELGHGVNYARPDVRDWMFANIEEVSRKFDIDGVELSFIRHGYCFPPSTAGGQHALMTGFMRRVRKMLDEIGQKRDRHLLLGARVPTTLAECARLGQDVPTWIQQGLIDYVAPSDYHSTDFNVQYEEFARLTRKSDCHLYPAIQADVPGNHAIMTLDNYRASLKNFYGAGADGFSTHNYDVYMWGQLRTRRYPGSADLFPGAFDYFKILRDPEAVAAGDRHYMYLPMYPHEQRPNGYRGIPIPHPRAVLGRSDPGRHATYRFRICEHLPESVDLPTDGLGRYQGVYNSRGRVPGVWLVFRALGMRPGDEIAVDINGHPIVATDIRHTWHQEGRPGWEGRPLPPYTECRLSLTAPPCVYGDNELGIKLLKSADGAEGNIEVDELEVLVHIRD